MRRADRRTLNALNRRKCDRWIFFKNWNRSVFGVIPGLHVKYSTPSLPYFLFFFKGEGILGQGKVRFDPNG